MGKEALSGTGTRRVTYDYGAGRSRGARTTGDRRGAIRASIPLRGRHASFANY